MAQRLETEGQRTKTPLRSPDLVMRLERLGSMHISRLSFTRTLVRRARQNRWRVNRVVWDMDESGYGRAVYAVRIGEHDYSLVAFSQYLPPEMRIDRVIAQAWDTCYVLYDGIPDEAELERLKQCVPYQEARRYTERELVLARANKSERLFDLVLEALAAGRQPEEAAIREIGYLLRTSAVYGNGKFGIADWQVVSSRPEFSGPFVAEMLTVWLIRAFTVDLVEHCARMIAPDTAVRLDPKLRRQLGIGNSTGLGMAPFLVRHPNLLHRWISARETALARVRDIDRLDPAALHHFKTALATATEEYSWWRTDDEVQAARTARLRQDLALVRSWTEALTAGTERPWDVLYRRGEAALSLEGQECLVSLLIEPHGALVDDLSAAMANHEEELGRIDGAMRCEVLARILDEQYAWALTIDFDHPDATARFWYTSQEKLEPRLGWRGDDEGDELELPLGFAREVARLKQELSQRSADERVSCLALDRPEFRHVIRRVQNAPAHPYGEIRDNVLGADLRPLDLMRCKLSFLGGAFFDPRSNLSLRIRLFQGAPFPDELHETIDDGTW
ncbi:hypothetical protein [Rhodoligotrophos defluvii]|uniref:hypothetical protein n=1 Tax=Rhodoligotrophos defluvii TaxID=2561934 RepID=UPI0010C9D958|nr:hypothetical protein [Rhodoligotrophos defluvii]